MTELLHHLVAKQSVNQPNKQALGFDQLWLTYRQLDSAIGEFSSALLASGLQHGDRVAIYLPKCFESVVAMFATSKARGVFVPINPVLKSAQVSHIIQDCTPKVLITNQSRWQMIKHVIPEAVEQVIVIDQHSEHQTRVTSWDVFSQRSLSKDFPCGLETDVAAIFYTSGSTGKAKGVVLSQYNMVIGAYSVAQYLESCSSDRLLAVQPLSFDYGFSQLTIAFATGASCYLMEYLFPNDIIKAVVQQQITSLALVPPLWIKLADMQWPEEASDSIRYFTNTGGAMPQGTLNKLRAALPKAKPYLMYGLTEAFRSCYLPPSEIDNKPGSFGKAIPNVTVNVINQQGEQCQPGEIGELVHSGPLVSLGYWNNPEQTALRFKPLAQQVNNGPTKQNSNLAVWSGDMVTQDADGYLYFVGRNDEMIKSSGYRISPLEIEEQVQSSGLVSEVVALGVNHLTLGQAIILLVVANQVSMLEVNGSVHSDKSHQNNCALDIAAIKSLCLKSLPNYMQPKAVIELQQLPTNANGKFDRAKLQRQFRNYFTES